MDTVTLPPELKEFAVEAIATGRFRDINEIVVAGVSLLRRHEAARAELLASVVAAQEEGDRDGWLTGDQVLEHARATIARRTGVSA